MVLVFVLIWVKSVLRCLLYIFHLSASTYMRFVGVGRDPLPTFPLPSLIRAWRIPNYSYWAVVLAQLVERSLPPPEICGSNPVILILFSINCINNLKEENIKRDREWPLWKTYSLWPFQTDLTFSLWHWVAFSNWFYSDFVALTRLTFVSLWRYDKWPFAASECVR